MRSKLLNEADGLRTFSLVFDIGDEVMAGLESFARDNDLKGSHFTALGAFEDAVLAYWNWDTREYEKNPVEEQVEVVTLVGNVAMAPEGDARKVHAHCVVGKRDGTALAGHLMEAHVRPTLEVVVTEEPEHLRRRHDEETGLALLEP